MKALIPAAGLGTRFLPATKAVPKEMLPVLNKPVIQYVVEEAAGVADEVVIVSSKEKRAIEEHFAPAEKLGDLLCSQGKTSRATAIEQVSGGAHISFVYQDQPLGLGHAVFCGRELLEEEQFFVLLGDTIIPDSAVLTHMKDVSDAHDGANVIAVIPVGRSEVSRFGIIAGTELASGEWKVDSLVEKPSVEEAPSNLAIFGRYLLSPRILDILGHTSPGAGGEIQLTDAMQELLGSEDMYAVVIDPSVGFDTGTVESWLATNIAFAEKAK